MNDETITTTQQRLREMILQVLEDQAATFVRNGAALYFNIRERRELLEFTADVIVSRIANASEKAP